MNLFFLNLFYKLYLFFIEKFYLKFTLNFFQKINFLSIILIFNLYLYFEFLLKKLIL